MYWNADKPGQDNGFIALPQLMIGILTVAEVVKTFGESRKHPKLLTSFATFTFITDKPRGKTNT
jgi:hypothetical protein